MALYNKHGNVRICSRCSELATTRVKSEWLGPLCLQRRKARQAQSTSFTPNYCACGKQIRHDWKSCEVCEEEYSEMEAKVAEIEAITSIDDVKEYLLRNLTR